jgi:NTP pyrophosphatase (non-canonical NTP hydrolase)
MKMDFNEYQELCRETAFYSDAWRVMYPALGLAGEVGEVCNKIKKIYRDDNGHMTDEQREAIGKELGDCLWYFAQLATDLDVSLDSVAAGNISKLASRKERGVLGGSGDDR